MKRYYIAAATAVAVMAGSLCGSARRHAQATADWFVNMDYSGFEFQIPAGTVVQKGSSFLAKYPDGSFGVSMTNIAKPGANQKIA